MKSHQLGLLTAAIFLPLNWAHASNASLIAGWDFSQYPTSGLNTIDNASFNGSLAANFSDFNFPTADVSPSYGTLYYDGQFGSTATTYATFDTSVPEVQPVTSSLLSARGQLGDGLLMSDLSSKNQLQVSGQIYYADIKLMVRGNVSLVFAADAQTPSGSWAITFAAQDFDDGASISWDVSTDGSAYAATGLSTALTTADQAYSVSFPQLQGASKVYLRAQFTGVNGGLGKFLTIDNVGIAADLDPPAGSFWLASPIIAGGWRESGAAYPGEAGIGLIDDSAWPWVYVNDPQGSGTWVWFDQTISGRLQFYAYIPDGDFWIMGLGDVGWYYSWEPGNTGWFPVQ